MRQDEYDTLNGPAGQATTLSVLILRLGTSWLALPAQVCREVTEMRVMHALPHRPGRIPLGLVNIRGELQLCLKLSQLLGLEQSQEASGPVSHIAYQRLVLIEHEADRWVLLVDELTGVEHCPRTTLPETAETATVAVRALSSGTLTWHDTQVLCLDPEHLCAALRRELL